MDRRFYALEVAYFDTTGYRKVFLVNSPVSFRHLVNHYPKLPVRVLVTEWNATPYWKVVRFLKDRYRFLSQMFPDQRIRFGHKGESYQRDVLCKARIPRTNVESLSVPSITQLEILYPFVVRSHCPYHMDPEHKCAEHVLRLVEAALSPASLPILSEEPGE